jgi:hypothetical protein
MSQKIRTKSDFPDKDTVEIGGWFNGKNTYLWIGKDKVCIGTISGQKLYRLAAAIVDQFDMNGHKSKR